MYAITDAGKVELIMEDYLVFRDGIEKLNAFLFQSVVSLDYSFCADEKKS